MCVFCNRICISKMIPSYLWWLLSWSEGVPLLYVAWFFSAKWGVCILSSVYCPSAFICVDHRLYLCWSHHTTPFSLPHCLHFRNIIKKVSYLTELLWGMTHGCEGTLYKAAFCECFSASYLDCLQRLIFNVVWQVGRDLCRNAEESEY